MIRKLTYLIAPLLILTSCSGTKWINGTWAGVGHQIDGKKWKVELEADIDGEVKVNYPTLSCGGHWEVTEKDKKQLKLAEKITTGKDKCDEGVDVEVKKLSKNQIEVLYYLRWYNGDAPIATAQLKKQ